MAPPSERESPPAQLGGLGEKDRRGSSAAEDNILPAATGPNSDPDRIYLDELITELTEARKAEDGAGWRMGDLAAQIEVTYGAHDLEVAAERSGIGYSTLRRYRWLAECYPESDRRRSLSLRHHEAVATRDDRLDWLERAETEGWSAARLRDEARLLTEHDRFYTWLRHAEQVLTGNDLDAITAIRDQSIEWGRVHAAGLREACLGMGRAAMKVELRFGAERLPAFADEIGVEYQDLRRYKAWAEALL